MADTNEDRRRKREEEEKHEHDRIVPTTDGGVSIPIGGGIGIDTHGHMTINIGGIGIPLGGD